jgi:hypothetical protein
MLFDIEVHGHAKASGAIFRYLGLVCAASQMMTPMHLSAFHGMINDTHRPRYFESQKDSPLSVHPHQLRHALDAKHREAWGSDTETASRCTRDMPVLFKHVQYQNNESLADMYMMQQFGAPLSSVGHDGTTVAHGSELKPLARSGPLPTSQFGGAPHGVLKLGEVATFG